MERYPTAINGVQCRLYLVWHGIKNRCENNNLDRYKDYGGRGITLCEEWKDYQNFAKWAYNNGYDDNIPKNSLSIDRIDNDKGYSPDNCRFVDYRTQCNNKRNNRKYSIKGITHTIQEWSRIYDIKDYIIRDRIFKLGWSPEKAITTPVRKMKRRQVI